MSTGSGPRTAAIWLPSSPLRVGGADRDRDERPQLELLGAHAAVDQPVPQRAGDGAEDDVVDGAAELGA